MAQSAADFARHHAPSHLTIDKVESDITKAYKANPNDLSSVYKELNQLRKQDKSEDKFQKDLAQINKDLEDQHILNNLQIVEDPGNPLGFNLAPWTIPDTSSANTESSPDDTQPTEQPWISPTGDNGGGGSGSSGGGSSGGGYSGGGDGGAGYSGDGGSSAPDGADQAQPVGNFDGSADSLQSRIADAAAASVGQEMWHGYPVSAENGCAASVSNVLKQAGAANLTSASDDSCSYLQNDLEKQGWTVSSTPQPGDVIFGYGGLSSGHVGIVGKDGQVFNNHSSTGKFSSNPLSYFTGNWDKIVVLKPPAGK